MNRRQSGFTTIELLVVAGTIALLVGVMVRFFSFTASPGVSDRLVLQMELRKASDELMAEIRRCSAIVRPHLGESAPFLVARDLRNRMLFLYLDNDEPHSKKYKKSLFRLVLYRDAYTGSYDPKQQRTLAESVRRLTFTSLDANSVQINLTIANDRQDFQCVTRVAVMNLGEIE